MYIYNFIFYLFIFGCAGSSLLLGFSLVGVTGGYSPVVLHGLFIAVASLIVRGHGLQWHVGSVLVTPRP